MKSWFSRRRLIWLALGSAAALVTSLARAAAPAGRYTIAAGTVLDNETGLMWQQVQAAGYYDFSNAATYCQGATTGGFSDWRVPSLSEIQTLVDEAIPSPGPTIDTGVFPTSADNFQTSSRLAGSPDRAFSVDFGDGSTFYLDLTTTAHVRCVR